MYRGIIQHRRFITDYLETKIRERGLELPVGYGRIYRVVYDSGGRGPTPTLSTMTTRQLVATLSHPNGWWRLAAQRLLVERQDTAATPALRALLQHADDRMRLHALWVLDGLRVLDRATVILALTDRSVPVRTAAIRVAEPFIVSGDRDVAAAVLTHVNDSALSVRRQLAASLAVFPQAERMTVAYALLEDTAADGVTFELAARAIGSQASTAFARITTRRASSPTAREAAPDSAALEVLAAQIGRAPSLSAVQQLLAYVSNATHSRTARLAIVSGLTRGSSGSRDTMKVSMRPTALLLLARSRDSALAANAERLAQRIQWPNKPVPTRRAFTQAEVARIATGSEEFSKQCAGCHQQDGAGLAGVAKSLAGSAHVIGPPAQLVRILLQGKDGAMLMPPVGAAMSDERIASVLSYIRNAWGNHADAIDAAAVQEIRGATNGRTRPWTAGELARVR